MQRQQPARDWFIPFSTSHPPTEQHEIPHQIKKEEDSIVIVYSIKYMRSIFTKQGGRRCDCDRILSFHSFIIIDIDTHIQGMSHMNIKSITIVPYSSM
mmetsp:Transcript_65045/g.72667  ORF Transcript_65045/g.72667 Transcript_65045/m.72667 type:complete len:98 (-) Transcript_65045:414-707(-)